MVSGGGDPEGRGIQGREVQRGGPGTEDLDSGLLGAVFLFGDDHRTRSDISKLMADTSTWLIGVRLDMLLAVPPRLSVFLSLQLPVAVLPSQGEHRKNNTNGA